MGGLFYYVLASSDTLGEALQRGARYSAILNEGITLRLRKAKAIRINFEYAGVPRHSDRHQIEFSIVALTRIFRQLTNRHLQASRVSFTHRRRNDTAELKTFFGSEVAFGAAADELIFPTSIKQIAVVDADPYLNDVLIKYCEQAIADRSTNRSSFGFKRRECHRSPFASWQDTSRRNCPQIGCEPANACTAACIGGLTFAGIMQSLKSDLAKRHLADQTLSISEIAWLLGYHDPSAFTHAFKRWTGRAPTALREVLC